MLHRSGGLAEGKAWGAWLWVFLTTVLNAVFVFALKIDGDMELALFSSFAIHGIVVLLGIVRKVQPAAFGL